MTENRPNLFVRFVRGSYRALDASRRFAMNLLFLLIVVLVLAAIAGTTPKLGPKTALVLAPRGSIVEQYSASPADRALAKLIGDDIEELQLRDVLRALESAATDPMIDRVVIAPDLLASAGHATLREIGAALVRFKKSGKEVIAYADGMDQRGYYLAAHADRIYLHPEGAVLLEGLGRYRTYFKDAFDKFGVEARLFRVGEYKSAGEPFIRSDQSPEAREADLYWMGDVWQRYLADIAKLRGLDAAALAASIDALDTEIVARGGDLAKLALDQKLVDELKTRDELRAQLIEAGAKDDDDETFRQIDVESYAAYATVRAVKLGAAQVAVVVAEGEIVDGDQPPGTVGGDSTAKLIRKAREDDDVKAIVLRVDSPGGGVFPSEVIRREIELTREAGKPVVASMGDVAASGGYWISMNADEIVASESTITGSIGIFGLWFNVDDAMAKLGLNTDGAATTWIAGAIDPTREYDPRLGTVIQSVIDRGYADFIGKVAIAREKTPEEVDAVARGRVWSGEQAKARGLVDTLGTFEYALGAAAKRAGLDDYQVRYIEKDVSPFDRFMLDLSASRLASFARAQDFALPASFLPDARVDELVGLRAFVRDAMRQRPAAIYAHCECGF
ncbi:MAG TPA: signal peptide peptidase SppA [Candidatus Saccharimonadia bacterium]|nr:signal peptide peptidase SppA [Candidatus Saccharimonadia bacterium]